MRNIYKYARKTWYNYEDAIVLNERVVREDLLTSVHVEEYSLEVRETKRGMEELTSDIPNVSEEGVYCVGMGSQLFPKEVVAVKDWAAITEKCRFALDVIARVR